MNILITGGSGFLGKILHDKLKDSNLVKTIGRSNKNDFCVDLSNNFIKLNQSFDCIIHTAGNVHNENHANGFNNKMIIEDFQITQNVLKSQQSNIKHFIFISSMSVYDVEHGEDIDVNSQSYGKKGYGLSKRIIEIFLNQHPQIEKLSIIRLPLIIGENTKGNLMKLKNHLNSKIPFILNFENGEKSVVYTNNFASDIMTNFNKSGIYNYVNDNLTTMEILNFIESQNNSKFIIVNKILSRFIIRVISLLPIKSKISIKKLNSKLTFKNGFKKN